MEYFLLGSVCFVQLHNLVSQLTSMTLGCSLHTCENAGPKSRYRKSGLAIFAESSFTTASWRRFMAPRGDISNIQLASWHLPFRDEHFHNRLDAIKTS